MATINNLPIAAAADDGGWSEAGYYNSSSATIIRLGDASDADYGRSAWFRWTTGITAGSEILSASINLSSRGVDTPIPTLMIRAIDEDNPVAPTSKANADSRARTTASVTWTPTAWTSGQRYSSPNIAGILQEVVDRPGFSGTVVILVEDATTGNTTLTGQLSVDCFESTTAATALLNVEYTPQSAPTASIGGPTTVATSAAITVTGTGTPTTSGATITGYLWRIISGGGTLNNTALQNPTYTAGASAGTTNLGLVVTDSNGLQSAEATRNISVTGGSGGATVNALITTSTDDGSYHIEGAGSTSTAGTTVAVGDSSSADNARWGWTRFALNVPQGSTITAATVAVVANGVTGTIPAMTLDAAAVDNGPAYTNRAAYEALTHTVGVAWTPGAWVGGTTYTSPSLVSVVQAIVNRAGWVSGNHILIFWRVPRDAWSAANVLTFRAIDGFPSEVAQLAVTYSGSAVATPNAGADQGPVDASIPVQLSASGSTGATTYLWRVISGGGSLSSTTIVNPTFKPPATVAGGSSVIGLKVNGGTAEDTVTVTYYPQTEWTLVGSTWSPVIVRSL